MSIVKIKQELLAQDNRCTDQPVFLVQRLVRDYGYDPQYSDQYIWVYSGDYENGKLDDDLVEELNELDNNFENTDPYEKVYYKERWEFVKAFFTERGAKDYLETDGHNLGKTRIYADGSFRNFEFREIRNFILNDKSHEALEAIRTSTNDSRISIEMQKMAAWGMEPDKWPKPNINDCEKQYRF